MTSMDKYTTDKLPDRALKWRARLVVVWRMRERNLNMERKNDVLCLQIRPVVERCVLGSSGLAGPLSMRACLSMPGLFLLERHMKQALAKIMLKVAAEIFTRTRYRQWKSNIIDWLTIKAEIE